MSNPNTTQRLRLYLIRHGEVEDAAPGKLLGYTDAHLSARGLDQARKLADTLSTTQLSAIYSSDLKRTISTAEIIAQRHQLQVQSYAVWREIDMGEWEGRTIAALYDDTPQVIGQLFEDPASFEYPGGESFAAFTARVQRALDESLITHKDGEVALVTHAGVCRAIIGSVLEMPMRTWLRLGQEYGCLSVIDWYEGNPTLQGLNLRNHV
jgi:alpha-ribazole phosphatase